MGKELVMTEVYGIRDFVSLRITDKFEADAIVSLYRGMADDAFTQKDFKKAEYYLHVSNDIEEKFENLGEDEPVKLTKEQMNFECEVEDVLKDIKLPFEE